MSFYHIGYQDPRALPQHPMWPQIKSLPGFGVDSALTAGINACIGETLVNNICDLDALVSHPTLYSLWDGNEIEQFNLLSTLIESLFAEESPTICQRMYQNQGALLESIRLSFLLDLVIEVEEGTQEQQAFVTLLHHIQQENYLSFGLPTCPTIAQVESVLSELFGKRIDATQGLVIYGTGHWDSMTLRFLWGLQPLEIPIYLMVPEPTTTLGLRHLAEGGHFKELATRYPPELRPTIQCYLSPMQYRDHKSFEGTTFMPHPIFLSKEDTLFGHPIGQLILGCYHYYRGELDQQGFLEQCITSPLVDESQRGLLLTLYHLAKPVLQGQVDVATWMQKQYLSPNRPEALSRLSIYNPQVAQLPFLLELQSQWQQFAYEIMEDNIVSPMIKQLMTYQQCNQWKWVKKGEGDVLRALMEYCQEQSVTSTLFIEIEHYLSDQQDLIEPQSFEGLLGFIYQWLADGTLGDCHLGGLSQDALMPTVQQQLPWPLDGLDSEHIFLHSGALATMYYEGLQGRGAFLTGVLDDAMACQGLQLSYSYIKTDCYGEHRPYLPLTLLGFPMTAGEIWQEFAPPPPVSIPQEKTLGISYRRYSFMNMLLCPYRFFLEEGLEGGSDYCNESVYEQYYENLLIEGVWEMLGGMSGVLARERLPRVLEQVAQGYRPYVPFWSQAQHCAREDGAKEYILQALMKGASTPMKDYAPSHVEMRKSFGTAYFTANTTKHPYSAFEQMVQRKGGIGRYPLHQLPKLKVNQQETSQIKGLQEEVKQYLNQSQAIDHQGISASWCKWCNHQNHCEYCVSAETT